MDEEIDIAYVGFVESRVSRALFNPDEKAFYMNRLIKSQDMNEIRTIHHKAEENQPIIGLEIFPYGQGEEMYKAIKIRADRDDFYDRFKPL